MVVINCGTKELNKKGYKSLQEWLDESPNNVYIGRGERIKGANKSKWCNPFAVATHGREGALRLFEKRLLTTPDLFNSLDELKGKNLACWCAPLDCHGHILEKYANMTQKEREEKRNAFLPVETKTDVKAVASGKDDIWQKKLKQMAKDKEKREADQKKQEEQYEVQEKAKQEAKEKRQKEKDEREKAKAKKKESIKKLGDVEKTEYNKVILDQIQPEPLQSVQHIDEISEILYREIIKAVPDTEFDGKARKYSYAITKMVLYGVIYPTPIMNEIDAIWRSLRLRDQ
jgi:hypothetical protein